MTARLPDLLRRGVTAVNVGVVDFAAALRAQGVEVIEVEWRPPAEHDEEIADVLGKVL